MPETATSTGLVKRLSLASAGVADVGLAVGVVAILLVMILPVPTPLLDLLLTFNVTFGIIVLLTAMYILKPLDFSVFPSLLLILTLYRLSLNVASTRLILLRGSEGEAAAGQVIKAFGSFVVGGNYVVGIIVFAILVVINFVVITKGATRIAEVAARFTLDAMPGKQMAIDADLNAGLIDEGRGPGPAIRYRQGSRLLRRHGRRGQVCPRRRHRRHHHHPHQHPGRPDHRRFATGHGPWFHGGPDLHHADRGRRPGLPGPGPDRFDRRRHHRQPRGQRSDHGRAEFTKQFTLQPRAMMLAGGISFLFGLLPGLPARSLHVSRLAWPCSPGT